MDAPYSLKQVRAAIPLLTDWTYLNTGTVGVMAEPVLQAHLNNVVAFERGGHTAQASAIEGYEHARRSLADLLGARPEDIGLNRNASDGINTVAAAFQLRPGDEVITSTEEHPAMVLPWLAACQRSGATLRFIPLSPDSETFRDHLAAAVTDSTRMVAISQVSCETGARIPVEIIGDVVGDETAILIDASQSVGQFHVTAPKLNADFVIGNGHKWLAGPKGTGFIWIRPGAIDLAPPVHFHSETVDPPWSRGHYQSEPLPALTLSQKADRYEFGTRAWHIYGALTDAIDYQASLGWDHVWDHVARVSGYCKAQLAEINGVSVLTPASWDESSGIVTFAIDGLDGVSASDRLWNGFNIAQRRVEAPSAVRVSVSYFTSTEDIDRLCDAVESLADDRRT